MNDLSALRMDLDELNQKTEAQMQATGDTNRNIINGLMSQRPQIFNSQEAVNQTRMTNAQPNRPMNLESLLARQPKLPDFSKRLQEHHVQQQYMASQLSNRGI